MASHPLKLIHPKTPSGGLATVSAEFSLDESGNLEARYEIRSTVKPYTLALPLQGSQWGLWEGDVVELFVSVGKGDYFEFQVSPLGQYFELKIFEPRKRFDREFSSSFVHGAKQVPGGWSAWLKIPLRELGWTGDIAQVRGNAFAILGEPAHRRYFSLFLPEQEKPDFHLPQHFSRFPGL